MKKNLFIYWHQGFDVAPFLVKRCVDRWEQVNPGWSVTKIDKTNVDQFASLQKIVKGIGEKKISLAHQSDILRFALISRHGGAWADATTCCNRPLDEWLPEYTKENFFAFSSDKFIAKPRKGLRPVSTWFLYGEPGNFISPQWLNAVVNYWKDRKKVHNYFAHHHLFADLYLKNQNFRKAWDAVPKLSNSPPHAFCPYGEKLTKQITPDIKEFIDSQSVPLFKLTRHGMHRFKGCLKDQSSVLGYLLSDRDFPMSAQNHD